MTTDLETLLRESIDRLTAGAGAPPGMVGRARRQNRRRRITIRATAAAGTALVAAVATIAVLSAAGRGPRPGAGGSPVLTVAYVTGRSERAPAAQGGEGHSIEEVRASGRDVVFGLTVLNMAYSIESPGSAVVPGVLAKVTAPQMITWTYRGRSLHEGISSAGGLVFHNTYNGVTTRSGKQVTHVFGAAYPARTRWSTILRGQSGSAPGLGCQTVQATPGGSDWRAVLSKLLACGQFRLDGHQQVDGVETIKLTSSSLDGVPVRETIWFNPVTYLPVRMSVGVPVQVRRHGSLLTYDFRWLPPTKANLAAWHAAIRRATMPPGFRALPPDYLPLTGGQARGGTLP